MSNEELKDEFFKLVGEHPTVSELEEVVQANPTFPRIRNLAELAAQGLISPRRTIKPKRERAIRRWAIA